jgi:formylglycine-generating enzyme required for sulfatase activity
MQIVARGAVVVELVPVSPGEFLMGSGNHLFSAAPIHTVSLYSGFLLGKYPVTQAQWRLVMGDG